MREQSVDPLLREQDMLLYKYQGLESTIGLYMPTEMSVPIVKGLDILKKLAPDHYKMFESHTRVIRATDEFEHSAVRTPVMYVSTRTIRKGRMYCLVTIVHESKHRQVSDRGIMLPDEEDLCIEEEANVLEILGEGYWQEMNMGFRFTREAYLGLRALNKNFLIE